MAKAQLPRHKLQAEEYLGAVDQLVLRPLEEILSKSTLIAPNPLRVRPQVKGEYFEAITIDIVCSERRNWFRLIMARIFPAKDRIVATLSWSFASARAFAPPILILHTPEIERACLLPEIVMCLRDSQETLKITPVEISRVYSHREIDGQLR